MTAMKEIRKNLNSDLFEPMEEVETLAKSDYPAGAGRPTA
jgi:hypothetical protein